MAQTYSARKAYLNQLLFLVNEMIRLNEEARKVEKNLNSNAVSGYTAAAACADILAAGLDIQQAGIAQLGDWAGELDGGVLNSIDFTFSAEAG